jgi:uncharacterized membrane protein
MVAQDGHVTGQAKYIKDLGCKRGLLGTLGLCGPQNVGNSERVITGIGGAGLAAFGLSRGGVPGLLTALVGGGLVYRAMSGHCPAYEALGVTTAEPTPRDFFEKGLRIEESVTIERSPAELYQFWRNFENLPRFMKNVESVQIVGEDCSRWTVKGPLGRRWEWNARIINEVENELIAWQTSGDADIQNAGSVRFIPSRNGRGTVVKAVIEYLPPVGKVVGRLGSALALIVGRSPAEEVKADQRRFKQIMETGEIARTDGQPRGANRDDDETPTGHRGRRSLRTHDRSRAAAVSGRAGAADPVTEASKESFPASDPPGGGSTS